MQVFKRILSPEVISGRNPADSTIILKRKEKIMKTFKQIAAQIERIERLYYNFNCGTKKMLETAERFFSSQQRIGLQF